MKDKLIAAIREVPISQTYEQYVEALAYRLEAVMKDIRFETFEEVRERCLDLMFPKEELYKDGEQ